MHYYKKHIPDFNSATRHLSRIERSIYSDLIEYYYDKEEPLPLDLKLLCRKIVAVSEEEKQAVLDILAEFFLETEFGYFNERCQQEVDEYQASIKNKSKAGRASAKARIEKRKEKDITAQGSHTKASKGDTPVKQLSNDCSTSVDNHKPLTNNQEPDNTPQKFEEGDMALAKYIFDKLKEMNPKQREPNFNVWAMDISKMRRIDNREWTEITEVFDWAHDDEFWCTNILSPAKLRKQFDTLLIKMGSVKKQESKLKLPAEDEKLWEFAKEHGLSNPQTMENFKSYRYRLEQEVRVLNNGQ